MSETSRAKTFRLVIMFIFVIMLMVGFFFFVTYKPVVPKDERSLGRVVIWGTLSDKLMGKAVSLLKDKSDKYKELTYIQKPKKNYNREILEALAQQNSPDLILLSYQDFLQNKNKLEIIPYTSLSQRTYENSFVDAFNIYLDKNGFWGIPFLIDPMVLYYNKSIFANSAVVYPPRYWEELIKPNGILSKLRVQDEDENILKAAIALGESLNISHFKEILYTLFFQTENHLILRDSDGWYEAKLEKPNLAVEAMKFYFQFSNPANKMTYTWNKSMENDQVEFLAENLAIYLGFSSEIKKIRLKNPNLNFDVAEIPGFKNAKNKAVFAKTWVWVIPKGAKNKTGAFRAASAFAGKDIQEFISKKVYLPPVRKDMLAQSPADDIFMSVFYNEALYSKSILEPDKDKIKKVFLNFVSNIQTGLYSPMTSINNLISELEVLLK